MRQQIIKIISAYRPELKFDEINDIDLFGVLDSLDIIMIVDEIENQFGITIEADQILPENFASLHVLEAFVKSLSK